MSRPDNLDFSTLLACSVHDMKNNVGLMINQLAQLQEQLGERTELDVLGMQASQLNQSLIQLLAVYKLEQNLYLPPTEEVYLDELCEDFQASHHAMLEALDIELVTDCEMDIPWTLDEALLQSVLATLVSNILQLKQQQPDTVSAIILRTTTQEVEGQCYLKISIDDDGPGFDSELWGHFEPKLTGVKFTSGNSGLGLYFSHLVARHHQQNGQQGFLQLGESEALGGASVSFYLP